MKKIVTVQEVEGEGLLSLLGKRVLLMCANYFYWGDLIGVNADDVLLDDCHIVYETGAWTNKTFTDAQRIGDGHYVRIGFIESYREAQCK